MEKVTLTKVFISDKNKDNEPFKTKDGKPFWKVGIKTQEYGEEWFSCLAFGSDDRVMRMKEGEEYTVVITETNGFKNFKLPTKSDLLETRIEALEKDMKQVKERLLGVVKEPNVATSADDDINPDEIPF